MEKKPIRLGVIGAAGSMAGAHQKYYEKIKGLEYVASCDISDDVLKPVIEKHKTKPWTDAAAMIQSGDIDAVFIACPHYDHPKYARLAFDAGVHVLCEKPVAVTALEAQRTDELYAAAQKKNPHLLFAGMFNQRANPVWKEVKRLCTDGSLGELMRLSWTITSWFRTQTYYDSGGWRATWAGEGGGVLLNQCPHNLDLLCWFVGSPSRVTANVALGKYHNIEVEDDVTAILEFPNGATGTFITTTGQSPGINRLEIVGTGGTLIAEHNKLTFLRAAEPVPDFTQNSTERFGDVAITRLEITPPKLGTSEHEPLTRNFIETLQNHGTQDDLIAPGTEGITGLELGNAMLMSGLNKQPLDIPTDRQAFADMIDQLKEKSTFQKKTTTPDKPADMSDSFA